MNFTPTKRLLTAILTAALLISSAACTNLNPETPQSDSSTSTTETAEESTTTPPDTPLEPSQPINERFSEDRRLYADGTTGITVYDKMFKDSSNEFKVETERLLSVTILSRTLVDVELKGENGKTLHQLFDLYYDPAFSNQASRLFENVLFLSERALIYLDGTPEERSLVAVELPGFEVWKTLEQPENYRIYPLADAAATEDPVVISRVATDYYDELTAFTLYYTNREDKLSAKTIRFPAPVKGHTLQEENPFKTALQNILRLNQYKNVTSVYSDFALIGVENSSDFCLILKADDKLMLIDNDYTVATREILGMERVYADGSYSWSKKNEDGTTAYGLRAFAASEGFFSEYDVYRAVTGDGIETYSICESGKADEHSVTKEHFEAFSAQFCKEEISWLPLTAENIEKCFSGESAVESKPELADYESIIELCSALSVFCGNYHVIGTPRWDYEVRFNLATEEDYDAFRALYQRIIDTTPASIMALNYECLFGYCLKDLDNDGVNELILLMEPWPASVSCEILGVFTLQNGKPVMRSDMAGLQALSLKSALYTEAGVWFTHALKTNYSHSNSWEYFLENSNSEKSPSVTRGELQGDSDRVINVIQTSDGKVYLGLEITDENAIKSFFAVQCVAAEDGSMTFDNGSLQGNYKKQSEKEGLLTITSSASPLLPVGDYRCVFEQNGK